MVFTKRARGVKKGKPAKKKNLVKNVNKVLRIERGIVNAGIRQQQLSTTANQTQNATYTNVCVMIQGNADGTRDGGQIGILRYEFTIVAINNGGVANTADIISYAVIVDKETQGVSPVWSEIYNSAVGTQNYAMSSRNLRFKQNYRVLKRGHIMGADLAPIALTTAVPGGVVMNNPAVIRHVSGNFKTPLKVYYIANNNVIADINKNNLTIGTCSFQAGLTAVTVFTTIYYLP